MIFPTPFGPILQTLYSNEINCGMQSFWDGGWTVWIGDEMNGRRAEQTFDNDELNDIPAWLLKTASAIYPHCASLH